MRYFIEVLYYVLLFLSSISVAGSFVDSISCKMWLAVYVYGSKVFYDLSVMLSAKALLSVFLESTFFLWVFLVGFFFFGWGGRVF